MLLLPALSALTVVIIDYYNQALTNFCVVTITGHGSISTFVMLIAHRPYRDAIKIMFRKRAVKSVEVSRRGLQAHRVGNVMSSDYNQ
ncbi:hypothetical protein GCK72_020203 [Caenorhabditis remanei]|uniref:G-protein coupled receptors family 1 profile domain-containing protein n=1 Tax=Caenorhabditis remanei TaxID=31234 RepID=A0A6A5GG09_CAERE|nr:hypothetical protein GCK72_020203 [Caenorhabditis remanei]KAF1753646.1 hypothetical protein GCK72_020203 [Caenorhabditis remanei]